MTQIRFLIGTYADGVYAIGDEFCRGQIPRPWLAAPVERPSWLECDGAFVYACSEMPMERGNEGQITAFRRTEDGLVAETACSGMPPVLAHMTLVPPSDWLMAASYGTGEICALRRGPDGLAMKARFLHQGKSVHPRRQLSAHPHSLWPIRGGTALLLCDLGTDEVLWLDFDPAKGTMTPRPEKSVRLPGGDGPRHLALSEDGQTAYVLSEMGYCLTALRIGDQGLEMLWRQNVDPSLPEAERAGGAIRLRDGFLYCSGRGARESRIDIFRLKKEGGGAERLGSVCDDCANPRDLIVTGDGAYVLSANLQGDSVSVFRRDLQTGFLTYSLTIPGIPSPACILELPGVG